MKKTLVALAALAAVGGAFAQSSVSLTGKFAAAYTSATTAGTSTTAGASSNGFEVTDGNITFAATEDLGAGMTAGASMDVKVRGRAASGSVDGRDGSLYVQGGFGRITMGAIEAGNGIIGLASAGAPTIGQDTGAVLDGGTNVDFASYTAKFGDVTATFMLIDSIGAPAAGGMESTVKSQDATLLGLAYASGPLTVKGDYTSFGRNGVVLDTTSATTIAATSFYADNRTRVSVSYDLGAAKLGAGYQVKNLASTTAGAAGNNDKQYMLGVSAPLGAFTVGATYAVRNNENNAADAKGYELGANYALSKRTGIQVAYLNQKKDAAGSNAATTTRIRLLHSF